MPTEQEIRDAINGLVSGVTQGQGGTAPDLALELGVELIAKSAIDPDYYHMKAYNGSVARRHKTDVEAILLRLNGLEPL